MTEREKEEALELLQDILRIPTVNGLSDEFVLAEYLKKYLKKYDIESRLQFVDEKRSNIIADIAGENNGAMVVWNGHLDTVPYGNLEEWNTDPSKPVIIDKKVYGRGTSDMKSGLAAMIYTLCRMKSSGKAPSINIRFIGTCDEEKGGLGALKILEEGHLGTPLSMLIGEPTDCQIGIAQKGCLWVKLNVKGKTSHGAYPDQGVNAVHYGTEICSAFSTYVHDFTHPLLKHSTAEITSINGGIAHNMVPDTCDIIMDIRLTPDLGIDKALSQLVVICKEYELQTKNRLQVSLEVLNERPSINTDQDNEWVALLEGVIKKQGLFSEVLGINYFTDASVFIKSHPSMSVILFGPGCPDMAHQPNEYVEINKYFTAIDVMMDLYSNS